MSATVVQFSDLAQRRGTGVDRRWEAAQEHAIRCFRTGDRRAALGAFGQGLHLARCHFQTIDPRYAASLANHAFGLRLKGRAETAEPMFELALKVWRESWRWVAGMDRTAVAPEERGRALGRFRALTAKGELQTGRLFHYGRLPEVGLQRWMIERDTIKGDVRRLVGSVLLLVSAEG